MSEEWVDKMFAERDFQKKVASLEKEKEAQRQKKIAEAAPAI
jgi:hypothetical protein